MTLHNNFPQVIKGILNFLNRISLITDYYLQTYENILTIGGFNLSVDNSHLEAFMQAYDFSSLIKKPICYQSNTPSCTDLILTNRKQGRMQGAATAANAVP